MEEFPGRSRRAGREKRKGEGEGGGGKNAQ
jgi:hypothetical protein